MRFLLYILSGLVFVLIAGVAAIFLVLNHYSKDLPDYHVLAQYEPKIVTRVHAGDGRLMAELATEKRVFLPIASIPKRVINAFLAAEDKSFYEHKGVDPEGILKAAIINIRNKESHSDKRPVGASTITQQVAKNFLLTNEVSFSRKIKEAILAFRIEQSFSKERILELYLNQIYLGQGTYGVAAAALNYFDKPLDQLTIAEAAFLGALPKAPNNYNPEHKTEAALERRNWVIGRMAEDGFITSTEAGDALKQPLGIQRPHDMDSVDASYFSEEVRRKLVEMYGDERVYGGGLSVRTTLDPKLQAIAVKSLRHGLVSYDERHGWRGALGHILLGAGWEKRLAAVPLPDGAQTWQKAVVLETGAAAMVGFEDGKKIIFGAPTYAWTHHTKASDILNPGDVILIESVAADPLEQKSAKKKTTEAKPVVEETHYILRQMPAVSGAAMAMDPHTGRVLAMVGGMSYANSEFNRATQAYRQPGSSFKPFVYMAALDKGFTPSTLILDSPVSFSQGPGLPMWQPDNYSHDFLGPTPLRVGIEKSRNVMTVRLAEYIGMPSVVEYAKKFGIVDNMQPNLSMALGAGETTLERMVTGYSMIVNGGKKITPSVIDRIQDRNGKTIYRHDTRACPQCSDIAWSGQAVPEPVDNREQIEDPRTAYQMVNILEGVIQRGTGHRIAALHRPLAGKTGTTNDSKDVWFIGFSPDLTVGVFVGYDQPKTLGGKETGATTAAPVFQEFMGEALADQPAIPFRIPPGIRLVRVNPASGQPDPDATNTIWEAFIPGTEPGGEHFVLDGSTLAAKLNERGEMYQEQGNGEASDAAALGASQDIGPPMYNSPEMVIGPNKTGTQPAPETTMGTGGLY